jgi:hypothetical protein
MFHITPRNKKRKRQICARLDCELIEQMEQIKKETGLSLSAIAELACRGYIIIKR